MSKKNLLRWSAACLTAFIFVLLLACNDQRKPEQETSTQNIAPIQKTDLPQYEIIDEKVYDTQNIAPVQKAALPQYEIVNEKVYDTQIKTQVVQHIVVSGEITEENLRTLLYQQHSAISKRTGFKYHESPTNIYIYIYDTKEKAKAGQILWLAMSQKSYSDAKPQVTVRTDQISRLGAKPQKKFGLTEAKRQEVFREIARVEGKSTNEAMKRFPSDINKQIDLERKLQEKYKDELVAKYKLTRAHLQSIMVEGVTSKWRY